MKNRFSCSYGGTADSFVICGGNDLKTTEIDHVKYGLFCVVQNIIQRGRPTKPSDFLKDKMGELQAGTEPIHLISKERSQWKRTIKGDVDNAYYPAVEFFDDILTGYLGKYDFVRNLILPEAYMEDILRSDKCSYFTGQQVDFYLSAIETVIEIDGGSHSEIHQETKDRHRDQALEGDGVSVLRIPTEDIRNRSAALAGKMSWLREKIENSETIRKYKSDINVSTSDLRIRYDAVIRIRMRKTGTCISGTAICTILKS
ncbi:MAG: DUF559 domain-containing protein [Eubacteriaceae bacterium]|nr:DUF559 domain-containing protein [Eubacteriaceae bacterium]